MKAEDGKVFLVKCKLLAKLAYAAAAAWKPDWGRVRCYDLHREQSVDEYARHK